MHDPARMLLRACSGQWVMAYARQLSCAGFPYGIGDVKQDGEVISWVTLPGGGCGALLSACSSIFVSIFWSTSIVHRNPRLTICVLLFPGTKATI